ncbi:MAG: helix-turn-helix domain-containing protein [Bacillota bacterium]
MDELKKTISRNIQYLRTLNQLTQYELGEKLNYSDKAISKWERAEAVPDVYILKKMSELFNVTVDYFLRDHVGEKRQKLATLYDEHVTIMKIAIVSVWTVALFIFIVFWLFGHVVWLPLIYAVPVSLIVLLVLNSIWGNRGTNLYIISALVWSVIAAIYVSLLPLNWWLLFLLGIPVQTIVYLCFKIKRKQRI